MTASATLKPEKPDGQVSVIFELDTSQLGGHGLMAFEALAQGKVTVATHEELKEEGQTVHVGEPKAPENPTTLRLLPKMGDDTQPGQFVATMVPSGSELVASGAWELCRHPCGEGGAATIPRTAVRTSDAAVSHRSCPTSARGMR